MKEGEYFIDFSTEHTGKKGKLDAVRVRIDLVSVDKLDDPLPIDLCNHPLYPELERYIISNPSRRKL